MEWGVTAHGDRFPFGMLKKILKLDCGVGHPTLNILQPLDCTLYMGGFYSICTMSKKKTVRVQILESNSWDLES